MFVSRFNKEVLIGADMGFEQLNDGVWAKTYLLVDENTMEAALVDPVYDYMDSYIETLEQQKLTLRYAIASHTHADHITACFNLRDITGCEYVMWHETACLGVSKSVIDQEKIMLGAHPITFHFAPGHTSDSMIIHFDNYLMTGDFLFTGDGGVGRDDLPGGSMKLHWDSLQVLNRFEGGEIVCTGHDPPGTVMQSLQWNRENNFVLKMTTFEEYEQWQSENNIKLGSVSKIKTAVPANLSREIPDVIPWLP